MNSSYKEIPRGLNKSLRPYQKALTKSQYAHFSTFVVGLIIHDKKTIQEINDVLSKKDQSSLNRSIKSWNGERLNEVRLACVQRKFPTREDGLIIFDDTLAHKTGRHMEMAGYHRSGVTKSKEWSHCIVNSYYTHPNMQFGYPITADIFTNKTNEHYAYRPVKRLALDQLCYARLHGVKGVVCADSLYYADYILRELDDNHEQYLIGTPETLKISINRAPRVSLKEYAGQVTYSRFRAKDQWYRMHSFLASIRNVGVRRIIISYREKDPDDKKFYVTNLNCSDKKLLRLLVCRWRIEVWHRDAKQHLGLEDYQVRKDRSVRNVVLAVLVAYTVLMLSRLHATLRRVAERVGRQWQTVGELCRFMRLATIKGWRWITRMLREELEAFKGILNREVVVKNAKV